MFRSTFERVSPRRGAAAVLTTGASAVARAIATFVVMARSVDRVRATSNLGGGPPPRGLRYWPGGEGHVDMLLGREPSRLGLALVRTLDAR